MLLLAERFVFEDDDQGFLKEGIKTYQMAPLSPFNLPTLICLHIFSLYVSDRAMKAPQPCTKR
jgi:hypothetical protein